MRQIRLGRAASLLLVVILVASGLGIIKGLYFLSSYSYAKFGLYKTRLVNQELTRRAGAYEQQSNRFSEKIGDLVAYEDFARLKYGLEPVSPEVRQVGVGGRPTALERVEESLTDPVLRGLHSVEVKLAALLRQTALQTRTFGEMASKVDDLQGRYDQLPAIWPNGGSVTSWFGYRVHPILGTTIFHEGLDISAPTGTSIRSTGDGVITFCGWDGGYGNKVVVTHRITGYQTVYAHMSRIAVRHGQKVKRGELLGSVGSTGQSTGPHCHYEVRRLGRILNPMEFILPDDVVVD